MTDTLTIYLSGDAYDGDAEAVIDVNGVQVSGTLDVSAANASDDVEAFTFTGDFGVSPQVSVSMVNDVYGRSFRNRNAISMSMAIPMTAWTSSSTKTRNIIARP